MDNIQELSKSTNEELNRLGIIPITQEFLDRMSNVYMERISSLEKERDQYKSWYEEFKSHSGDLEDELAEDKELIKTLHAELDKLQKVLNSMV